MAQAAPTDPLCARLPGCGSGVLGSSVTTLSLPPGVTTPSTLPGLLADPFGLTTDFFGIAGAIRVSTCSSATVPMAPRCIPMGSTAGDWQATAPRVTRRPRLAPPGATEALPAGSSAAAAPAVLAALARRGLPVCISSAPRIRCQARTVRVSRTVATGPLAPAKPVARVETLAAMAERR
jgi:hypothetical protein